MPPDVKHAPVAQSPRGRVAAEDAARWAAVAERHADADGRFVYAVRTTGIYCRPSCPSRRPRRENVTFYDTADAAAAGGYRACRRCAPGSAVRAPGDAVTRARALLEARTGEALSLDALAREVGVSPFHLQRTFKRELGLSPHQYAAALRADRLKAELRHPGAAGTVSRATFEAGYGASSRAYEAAERHLGMTPAAYRRGGAGVRVRYALTLTPFGHLLLAATDRGVCAITLGDDDDALERALAGEYPNATRERVDAERAPGEHPGEHADLREWLRAVVDHLAGARERLAPAAVPAVPVDAPGTPFQGRVWQALREIPYGETRSYSAVAAAVGAPRAVRAVASACARNRVALIVPCHRVVREGGALGGYRWGVDRKRRLLAHEHGIAVHRIGGATAQ
ncbi:MAG: bifunctional DNA-binding transcriptional regulator/O6-methylguanine-DNA methyltransferase Ada [Gemmatimonadaceae bacterium]